MNRFQTIASLLVFGVSLGTCSWNASAQGNAFAPNTGTLAPQGKSESPPKKGERAIDFELPVVGGEGYVQLQKEYDKGPVVLIFLRGYPGYQCPLCRSQVSSLINRGKALEKFAHRVILVYPGPLAGLQKKSEAFLGGRKLPEQFVMVRDDDMKTTEQWNVRWNQPRETAYPSTFIINSNGRVVWSKVSRSHAGRSRAEEILAELRRL